MDKIENNMYYQTGIKTSRNEDSVYAMKYASQQMMIDKLQKENQQLKSQLEQRDNIINKAREKIKLLGKFDGKTCTRGFQMWVADFNQLLEILDNKGE